VGDEEFRTRETKNGISGSCKRIVRNDISLTLDILEDSSVLKSEASPKANKIAHIPMRCIQHL
jgi:hypothetical protein